MTQTITVDQIKTRDGFNPRDEIERKALEGLGRSIKARGLLQPLVVTSNDSGFYLIDGHRRFAAIVQHTDIVDVPVVIRDAEYADRELEQAEAEQLIDAVTANTQREQLSPLEEAKAFGRLKEAGYHVRQIATELGVSQKLVAARLALLDLPADVQGLIAKDTVSVGFVAALVDAAKVNPCIASALAAGIAADAPSLQSFAGDPLSYLDDEALDNDAWLVRKGRVMVSDVPLSDQGTKDLNELNALAGTKVLSIEVPFELLEQGVKGRTVFAPLGLGDADRAWTREDVVVVTEEWMSYLVEKAIHDTLTVRRSRARELGEQQVGDPAEEGGEDLTPEQIEERAKEAKRKEREAELKAREQAHARNMTLGATLQQKVTKVELTRDVAVALATLVLELDVEELARAGAKFCLSQLQTETTQKNGKVKLAYDDDKAADWIRGYVLDEGSGEQVLARLAHVLGMGAWVDQTAVAQSNRIQVPSVASMFRDQVAVLCAGAVPDAADVTPGFSGLGRTGGLIDAGFGPVTDDEAAAAGDEPQEG